MKKRIFSIILFIVILFSLCFCAVLIKSEFGHLPLFFLTQDNVRRIELTQSDTYNGSLVTRNLTEREKMIFISMYSKKLRFTKSDSKYSLETIRKYNQQQGKVSYFTIYLKPFGRIRVEGLNAIGNTLCGFYNEKYRNTNFAVLNFYLNKIDNEDFPADLKPRYYEVEDEK